MNVIDYLLSNGWKEYENCIRRFSRNFYKQFDTPTRCRCNDDKNGIQIGCHVYGDDDYEFSLSGELPDGTCIKFLQCTISDDIEKGLELIPRMLATWEFIANFERL